MRSVGNFNIFIYLSLRSRELSVLRPTRSARATASTTAPSSSRLLRDPAAATLIGHRMMSCCVSVVALHTLILGVKGSLKVECGW